MREQKRDELEILVDQVNQQIEFVEKTNAGVTKELSGIGPNATRRQAELIVAKAHQLSCAYRVLGETSLKLANCLHLQFTPDRGKSRH